MNLMAGWKEGERVKVVQRAVTDEDRKSFRYFAHIGGLTGVIQSVYSADEIAVKVDPSSMSPVTADVHRVSVERMREKFLNSVSEEQKKLLAPEELNFNSNFVILVRGADLERG